MLQRSCPARRGRVGAETMKAKKIILTMQFSAGTSGFKICPLSTSKTPNYGKSRILWVTGTLWGLVCPCNCPAPSPSHCWAGDSWWSQSRAGTSTAHISPHTLSCSAVFPWTYLSSPSCCVLWRSKTRCPEWKAHSYHEASLNMLGIEMWQSDLGMKSYWTCWLNL